MEIGKNILIVDANYNQIFIERLEDDLITNRISSGGSKKEGLYCRFRGELSEVIEIQEQILKTLKLVQNEQNKNSRN